MPTSINDEKLGNHEYIEDQNEVSKRRKFSKIFFIGLGIAFLIGIIITAVKFTSKQDYNIGFNDATNLNQPPPKIYVPNQKELMVRAEVMEAKRAKMIAPPPLSSYKEKTLIHINTDKPFYQPNEVLIIEAFLIDSISKKPIFAR